jgi:hypothetical protein
MSPSAEDIDICDIAHALSNTCRFTGHCRTFYSVAQHSVLVSKIMPEQDAKWGLMHDASEAYLTDIAKPIKCLLSNYAQAEETLMKCVAERFGLPWPMPQSVHLADITLLATEKRDLMPPGNRHWTCLDGITPLTDVIEPWEPREAERMFMGHFTNLFAPVSDQLVSLLTPSH